MEAIFLEAIVFRLEPFCAKTVNGAHTDRIAEDFFFFLPKVSRSGNALILFTKFQGSIVVPRQSGRLCQIRSPDFGLMNMGSRVQEDFSFKANAD